MMKKLLILLLLISSSLTLAAQKKEKLAYYDEDSILKIWPAHRAHLDSIERYKDNVRKQLISMSNIYMRKDSALRADSATLNKDVYAVREAELKDLTDNFDAFVLAAEQELKSIAAKFDSLSSEQMYQAAVIAARKKGYKLVETKSKALQMEADPKANYEMIEITRLVMIELKIALPLPKR